MRLLSVFVLLLLFGACQQRYGHVKRVKGDKTQTSRAKEKEKLQADSSALQSYADSSEITISGSAEVPDKLQGDILSVVPEEKGSGKEKELTPGNKPKLPSQLNKIFPGIADGPGEEPPSKQEIFLILAIFTLWIILIVIVIPAIAIILSAEFLFFTIWFGGWSFLFAVIVIYILLGLLLSTLAYFIAKRRIRKRIPKKIDPFDLFLYYLLVLVIVILFLTLMPPLLLIMLIVAIIISIRYEIKSNPPE